MTTTSATTATMLTARTAPQQRTQGYQEGADIYLSKPASNDELAAQLGI